jgi:N,N'-diacetyllegionaminate synthase
MKSMNRVYVIAEIGVNHNGSVDLAHKLIDKVKESGADAAKFQIFKAENVISPIAEKALYQKQSKNDEESQLEMVKRLQLDYDAFHKLKEYCEDVSIDFMCSPFDEESFNYLRDMGVSKIKIPSGEITNIPLLRIIGNSKLDIILSTGMSTLGEIERALFELNWPRNMNITLLHCNTDYPTNFSDVNLNAMKTLKSSFGLQVGYSDHTIGSDIPIAAVAMGATVIEKHITLDNSMPGPDHQASMNPEDFKSMVSSIRGVELAIGNGVKIPSKSEIANIDIVRKSIVAKNSIKKGGIVTKEDLDFKRPGNGISTEFVDIVVGLSPTTTINKDEVIMWDQFKQN